MVTRSWMEAETEFDTSRLSVQVYFKTLFYIPIIGHEVSMWP